jgi:hypothetical protein
LLLGHLLLVGLLLLGRDLGVLAGELGILAALDTAADRGCRPGNNSRPRHTSQ